MNTYALFSYGTAADVRDRLYSVDPATISTAELLAALYNCFDRIDRLERRTYDSLPTRESVF